MKCKVAASMVIYRIPAMSLRGRKNVVNWMRRIARDMLREPESFSRTFRARYFYGSRTDLGKP